MLTLLKRKIYLTKIKALKCIWIWFWCFCLRKMFVCLWCCRWAQRTITEMLASRGKCWTFWHPPYKNISTKKSDEGEKRYRGMNGWWSTSKQADRRTDGQTDRQILKQKQRNFIQKMQLTKQKYRNFCFYFDSLLFFY